MAKTLVIDINRCNGCHACQIACKDEYCEQAWLPYSEAQPMTGQFWIKVNEIVRGSVPVVRISYIPTLCAHCDDAPCIEAGAGAVYRREDGLVIIDPSQAKGNRQLVAACPQGSIFYNDNLKLPQKCTGCAHLLDAGWKVPRCVDVCPTDALSFMDDSEEARANTREPDALIGLGPHVLYKNYPKRFIAGCVVDLAADEVVIGATVSLFSQEGLLIAKTASDAFGDYRFDQIEADEYQVVITVNGYFEQRINVDVRKEDKYVGETDLSQHE